MIFDIENSWKLKLSAEFDLPYYKNLAKFVEEEYESKTCFPTNNQIFSAFNRDT
mgnify:CR=1 FL=1